jgi:hypothetical protein
MISQVIDQMYDFYCRPSVTSEGLRSRYELWEKGEALDDSVTPSTYCPEYRMHMVLKIDSLSKQQGHVFSLGCGNAFVEADLVARGLQVEAIDCHVEAVKLASAKGVKAFIKDYYELASGNLAKFNTIYADGFLGHMYEPARGLDRFFETLLSLKPAPGTLLVFSNDAPLQSSSSVAPNKQVNGFWLLSREYITESLERFGFDMWENYHFPYERPLSGLRNRTICIARVRD